MWNLTDTRDQEAITYGRVFLTWQSLMLFLLKLGSRRQMRGARDGAAAVAHLHRLRGAPQKTRTHRDTVEHFHRPVPTRSLEDLRHQRRHHPSCGALPETAHARPLRHPMENRTIRQRCVLTSY